MKLRAKNPTGFLSDENRLDRVQGPGGLDVGYTYDTSGRMMTRTSGGVTTRLTWDGWDCVREETGSSVTIYHIPDGTLHSFSLDGVVYQCHADALSSIRMITDASGAVVARLEYGAWGEEIFVSAIPTLANFPYRFVGALGVRYDSTTGLHYMRARWYDSQLQRFISWDSLMSANRYEYAANSPQDLVDVTGLAPEPGPTGGDYVGGGIWSKGPHGFHNYGTGPKARIIPPPSAWYPASDWTPTPENWASGGPTGGHRGPIVGSGGPTSKPDPCSCPKGPPGVSILENMKAMRAILKDPKRNTSHKMITFYKLVNYGGTWDYKELNPKQLEAFGNFHYGAVGHALGLSDQLLLRAAGWAQIHNWKKDPKATPYDPAWGRPNQGPPYGDQPHDQVQIKLGIEYARKWEREGCPDTP